MFGKSCFLFAASLLYLSLDVASASAQYPQLYDPLGYRYSGRARLSPYLNLIRNNNNNNNVNLGIDYYLGVVPERERRFNDQVYNQRFRTIEQELIAPLPPVVLAEIPAVPTAGKPIGSRTSASYFKTDTGLGNVSRSRRSPR